MSRTTDFYDFANPPVPPISAYAQGNISAPPPASSQPDPFETTVNALEELVYQDLASSHPKYYKRLPFHTLDILHFKVRPSVSPMPAVD